MVEEEAQAGIAAEAAFVAVAASFAPAEHTEVAAAAAAAAIARTAVTWPVVVAVLADTACLAVEASVVPSGFVAEALLVVAVAEAAFSSAAAWADFAFQVDPVAVACLALRKAFVVVDAAAGVIDRRKVPIDLVAPRPAELASA